MDTCDEDSNRGEHPLTWEVISTPGVRRGWQPLLARRWLGWGRPVGLWVGCPLIPLGLHRLRKLWNRGLCVLPPHMINPAPAARGA